jgi:predicted  nucleic acid-binding Zn-ribbon protein
MSEPTRLWCVRCQHIYDYAPDNARSGCPECGGITWVAARYAPDEADATARQPALAQLLSASVHAAG